MTVRIHSTFNLSPRDGVECMNELKVRLHNLNSPFMQNRDGKMRSEGAVRNTLYQGKVGVRLKYLPRGSLEVCSTVRGKILMDYVMIRPTGWFTCVYFARFSSPRPWCAIKVSTSLIFIECPNLLVIRLDFNVFRLSS